MGFQFKFFTPVVELRLENDLWIVKMEYYRYSLKYLTVHIKCVCVMSKCLNLTVEHLLFCYHNDFVLY